MAVNLHGCIDKWSVLVASAASAGFKLPSGRCPVVICADAYAEADYSVGNSVAEGSRDIVL